MRHPARVILIAVLLSALALAGCADSSAPRPVVVPFRSPAVLGKVLPARYTCDGANVSPPMEWGSVPPGTRELVLFMLSVKPDQGAGYSISVAWGMAGINPRLHKLAAGEVPAGAHVALTNEGRHVPYSVCPARGQTKSYEFTLYAVPPGIHIPAQFVGIKVFQAIGTGESPDVSTAGGTFVASYTRPAHVSARRDAGGQG